ncbi:hypothetical protein A3Q56_05219 [Intoshia linei]|uniref:Uncharacterized protein n=1 Tax=Intoshia linei TaxID=1819745 RepID=A0A177B0R6_9BILA|nr:hypothetical protein A3Q56_05219 [Intoshia linei]
MPRIVLLIKYKLKIIQEVDQGTPKLDDAICLTYEAGCEISLKLIISSWKNIIDSEETVLDTMINDNENIEDTINNLLNVDNEIIYERYDINMWFIDGSSSSYNEMEDQETLQYEDNPKQINESYGSNMICLNKTISYLNQENYDYSNIYKIRKIKQ